MRTTTKSLKRAKDILSIYAYFKSEPGRELAATNFLAVGRRRKISASDLQSGLNYATWAGWLEFSEGGLRLTEKGFKKMKRLEASVDAPAGALGPQAA
jgi:hypothetical protein